MAKLVLGKKEIREITFVDADNKYSNGKRKEAGKTYSRYQYFPDGAEKPMVFTVESTNPFVALFGTGKIETVTLNETTATKKVKAVDDKGVETESTITTPALDFVNCVGSDQVDNEEDLERKREFKKVAHEARMKVLLQSVSAEAVNQETLNALLTANI